jgi:hypothetical protein
MRSPTLQIALAGSWRGGRVDRRRAGVLALAVAIVTLVACGCASTWLLSGRIDDRATARSFAEAEPGEPASLERAVLYDETADGEQITVTWWRVVDPSARVIGVPARPAAGSWWVSPALADRMADDPALASRYAGARRIAPPGLAYREELTAYRFLSPGPPLGERLRGVPALDGFGDTTQALELFPIAMGAVGLVGIPGLGLLLAALSPFATSMERRSQLLRSLGAPGRTQVAVTAIHVGSAAVPGAIAGALSWWVWGRRLTEVPAVGRAVFPGDLALPLQWALLVATGTSMLTVVAALARGTRASGGRPTLVAPRRPSALRVAPLVAGLLVAFTGSAVLGGPVGARWFLVGLLTSTVGAVVALPVLVDVVGLRLAAGRGLLSLLVGRRLRWNAATSVRSLLAVGALAVLVPVIAAWVADAREPDPVVTPSVAAVGLHGDLPAAEALALADRTDSVAVRLAVVPPTTGGAPPQLVVIGECGAVSAVAPVHCDGATFHVAARDLGLDGFAGDVILDGSSHLPDGAERAETVFVGSDIRRLDDQLRGAVVNGQRPGLQVSSLGRQGFRESPLVGWLLGAVTIAGAMGILALLLHLSGQAAQLARARRRLGWLGVGDGLLQRLAAAEAMSVVLVVGLGCAGIGAVESWLFVGVDHQGAFPSAVVGLVVAGVVGAAAVSAAVAAATASIDPSDLSPS